jgi:DNA polymerase-3 subunit delta'
MRFSEIIGLDDLKQQLIGAVLNNHVAHAQLFFGPKGSGNMALALAYATFINCQNRSETDSCGTCSTCTKMDKLIHPDLQFVFPVSSTKKITGKNVVSSSFLKEWREFLLQSPYASIEQWNAHYGAENKQGNISKEESRNIIKNLSLKAFEAEYKVMLIWLPEYMNAFSANGILKILEEPPEKTLFLLVTNDYEQLLTTILSRCQLFNIRGFRSEEVADYLVSNQNLAEDQAHKIAALSEGNINRAVKLIDSVEDDSNKFFRDWMRQCWGMNMTELASMMDSYNGLNKTSQKMLLQYGLGMMREALMTQVLADAGNKLNADELDFASKFGKALSAQKLEDISNRLGTAQYHLERNANPKIMFMDLSLSIGKVMNLK